MVTWHHRETWFLPKIEQMFNHVQNIFGNIQPRPPECNFRKCVLFSVFSFLVFLMFWVFFSAFSVFSVLKCFWNLVSFFSSMSFFLKKSFIWSVFIFQFLTTNVLFEVKVVWGHSRSIIQNQRCLESNELGNWFS